MSLVNYRSEDDIASEVFKNLSYEDVDAIKKVPHPADMIEYHHTVGRWIRNHYKLWERPYTPEINQHGVDVSEQHPDAISDRILQKVWIKVHNA